MARRASLPALAGLTGKLCVHHPATQPAPHPPACCRRYQGHVSAALVLGGVDFRGPHLFTVYPHGSTDSLPYCTMGSGSLNAMAVFESGYKDDLTKEEAMALVARAIR